VAALALVFKFGSRYVPLGDDISGLLPGVVQPLPRAAEWLWSPHNEHRVPLAKLILWSVLNATDFDLKVVQYLNVVLAGAAGAILILAARRIRGHTAWTDAFFPLVLMSWGQRSNFLNAWQLHFMLSTFSVGVLLTMIVTRTATVSPGKAIVSSVCVLLLPLCGGNGLLLVPAFALWLAIEGAIAWRMMPRRWPAGVMLGSAVAAVALIGIYMIGLETKRDVASVPPAGTIGLADYGKIALELLSTASGPPLYEREHWSLAIGAVIFAMLLASTIALVYLAVRRPSSRFRAIGLTMALGAIGCFIVAYAISRAPYYPGVGLQDRYYTLIAPGLCAAYFSWVLWGGKVGATVQILLLALVAYAFEQNAIGNDCQNLNHAGMYRYGTEQVEKAVGAGKPIAFVAQIWATTFATTTPKEFEDYYEPRFRMLQAAKIGPYRFLPGEPELHRIKFLLDSKQIDGDNVSWKDGVCRVLGDDPRLVFTLPEPLFVYKIRVTYRYLTAADNFRFELGWRLRGATEFEQYGAYLLPGSPEEKTVTVLISEKIDQFRIQPAGGPPCEFQIMGIELIVPKPGSP
jgi:hypothetical protein